MTGIIKYYSQNGEDYLLSRFFDFKKKGFYVDVGAFDGVHLSNSYSFEQQGWKGICIEPQPDYYQICSAQRKDAICINAACVGDGNVKSISLKTDATGLFSSAKFSKRQENIKGHYSSLNMEIGDPIEISVPAIMLGDLLGENVKEEQNIDFLSIDVEGLEFDVLAGIDLNRYAPTVIVMETNTTEDQKNMIEYLGRVNYFFSRKVGANSFFLKSEKDCKRLARIEISCVLEKQIHPLGEKYTQNEYLEGKYIYKGKTAKGLLHNSDKQLQSLEKSLKVEKESVNKWRERYNTEMAAAKEERKVKVVHLQAYIDELKAERKEKSAKYQAELSATKSERDEKVKNFQAIIDEIDAERKEKSAKQQAELSATKSERDEKVKYLQVIIDGIVAERKEKSEKYQFELRDRKAKNEVEIAGLQKTIEVLTIKAIPTLSILVVTYNAGDVLEKTFNSILGQTFSDYEIIVIDGKSTDNTLDIINNHQHKISYWVSEKDDGIYDAMNKAMIAAKGDYIQFLNAGDYYAESSSLESIFSSISDSPTLIYGDINVHQINDCITYQKAGKFELDDLLARGTGVLCHQAMFVRRERAPLYKVKYKYKAELNWYFDLVELNGFTYKHYAVPVVLYSLGGFGYQNFIRNRMDWIKVVYKRYGIKVVLKSRIIIFLYFNSLYRYPLLAKVHSVITFPAKKIVGVFRRS